MNTPNKRDRLINAAATLFHRRGIVATSLADIAKDADIPIGNVYYYFKTKEELALSAVALHREEYVTLFTMLNDTLDDPRTRLKRAVGYFDEKSDEFARYGCPVGKIVMDAGVDGSAIAKAAAEVLECFLAWAQVQFSELGYENEAEAHAGTLLGGIQGAIVVAKALRQPEAMQRETARLHRLIDALPNKRISLGKVAVKTATA